MKSKANLEAQYKELSQERNEITEQMLQVKGALMWVKQVLKRLG